MFNGPLALGDGIKYASISAAAGDTTVVSAISGKRIVVLACILVADGAAAVRFESGTGGTALTGLMTLTASSGFTLPFNEAGWCQTAAGSLLNLKSTGAGASGGMLVYTTV